jgi:hypothetical protein
MVTIFWNVMPCILVDIFRRFRGSCRIFTLAVALNPTYTQTTHHHIREDGSLHIYRFENLRTYYQITAVNCSLTQPKLMHLNLT